jgi:hypothetical protein
VSTVTAIIGDCASVGAAVMQGQDVISGHRRNPQVVAARIRNIQNPHTVQDALGGYISADFTIPSYEALRWRPVLRYRAVCWLFDGATPIFHGWLQQPIWTTQGDCQVTLMGAWQLLSQSYMREAWEMLDTTLLQRGQSSHENRNGQFTVNSDGSVTLSIPASTLAGNDICSVDYLLFGEPVGPDDEKTITTFEVDVSASQNLGTNRRFRVVGKSTAAAATGDQLWDVGSAGFTGSSGLQGAQDLALNNQAAVPWPQTAGYRCLRFEIINTAGSSAIAADWYVTLDRIRIGTREPMLPPFGTLTDTAAIARDLLLIKTCNSLLSAGHELPQEFLPSAVQVGLVDANTFPYSYGLDPRFPLSSAPNSGIEIQGFTALEWQSPADVLAALAAIDNCRVGFYTPYGGRAGYDAPGLAGTDVGSSWLTAPPCLVYQAFTDPTTNPDYLIFTRQGAVVEPTTDTQPLADVLYTNFQSLSGRQLSEVVTDADTRNYAWAQGFRSADTYAIQPPVGPGAATSLGEAALTQRRQPAAAATITITNTSSNRTPILKAGATIPHLATIRPGSAHIADQAAATNLRAGYITHVEWWGQTLDQPETVQLTLANPGQMLLDRRLAIAARRANRERTKVLP